MSTEGPTAASPCISLDARDNETASAYSIGLVTLALLAFYFALQVITRILLSSNLQLDEAEQFVLTQHWRLGYGSQPPLYTWLQHALFALSGPNVAALSILKNFVLWTTYLFTFLSAREILRETRLATVAAIGLLFIPQIAWESQRDQSHLTLATAFSAITLFVFVRLLKNGQWRWYWAFGVTAALGVLSKYNYVLLPTALMLASITFAPFRQRILSYRMIACLAPFLAVASPHLLWMLQNKEELLSQTYKFAIVTQSGVGSLGTGTFQTVQAALALFAAPVLVFAVFVWRRRKPLLTEQNHLVIVLWRSYGIGIAITLVVVWCCNVTYVRDRWLQPLLFSLPIALTGLFRSQIDRRCVIRLSILGSVIAFVVIAAINGTALFANQLRRPHNLNIPYTALAAELRKAGFEHGTILASGFLLGGNLKNQFPESQIEVPEVERKFTSIGQTLIVWTARNREIPETFIQYAKKVSGISAGKFTPTILEIPCENGRRKSEIFGFFLVNDRFGN